MAAPTQHDTAALPLQSTVMSANVVFINIDWKKSRHNDHALNRNMKILDRTIAGVVHNMTPAMICMCEVGEAHIPLTKDNMQQVADQTKAAWRNSAIGNVKLDSMFEVGKPYLTVYDVSQVQCSGHRILEDLYLAHGQPRTAQAFLCRGPHDDTVDIINVHAPSGSRKLNDEQRTELITNLLQSNSQSMPGHTIGSARFLIGGDMNTAPFSLSVLLRTCRKEHVLQTKEQVIEPRFGKHGDVAFFGGFTATCLTTTANNHDPRHNPYGICWVTPELYAWENATEPSLAPLPARSKAKAKSATPQRAAPSDQHWSTFGIQWVKAETNASACATEQPVPALPMPATPTPAPMPATTKGYATEQPSSVLVGLEDVPISAGQGFICKSNVKQASEAMHVEQSSIAHEFQHQIAFDNPAASSSQPRSTHGEEWHKPQSNASGYATEPPLSALPMPTPMLPTTGYATEPPSRVSAEHEALDVKHGNIVKPETNASVYAAEPTVPASPVPATPTPVPKPATPTGHATEQPSSIIVALEDKTVSAEEGFMCKSNVKQKWEAMLVEKSSIVNECLDQMTSKNPAASSSQPCSTHGEEWNKPQTNALGCATEPPLPAAPIPSTEYATEHPSRVSAKLEVMHVKYGNILRPQDYEQAPHEKSAAAATEQSEEATEMIYSIVNEFLGKMTMKNPEAEHLLRTALKDESCLTLSALQCITEVFSPIFFYYPNGLQDRSLWEPRDAGEYIRQWRELEAWRECIRIDANAESTAATEHTKQLSKEEITQIFKRYMHNIEWRTDQQNKGPSYYKGCTETNLRRKAGSTNVAYAIWEIGLPRLPPFATEQQGKQLSQQELEAVPEAIRNVLNWLDLLACALKQHKSTPEYQKALRKSGVTHRQSGLNATELETRKKIRDARLQLQTAKKLARQWNCGELTRQNCAPWQERLLRAYWNGSLEQGLKQMSELSNADPMCRRPRFAHRSM